MNKKWVTFCTVVMMLVSMSACGKSGTDKQAADQVYTNGSFYTMDNDGNVAEALAVKDGKIIFTGSSEDSAAYVGKKTETIDLEGQTVVPGFVDSHTHVGHTVEKMFAANLSDGESFEDYLVILKKYATEHADEPAVFGAGWISPYVDTATNPRAALDAIESERPMILIAEDRHTLWLNSKALSIAGIDGSTPDPAGGKIGRLANGEPNGILYETAAWGAIGKLPTFSMEQMKESLIAYDRMAAERGITQVNNILIYNEKAIIEALLELEKEKKLNVTHHVSFVIFPSDPPEKLDELLAWKDKLTGDKIQFNSIKLFDDGVVEGGTALLLEDYTHQHGYKGFSIWEEDAFRAMVQKVDAHDVQLHIHVIGDGALKQTLDALEAAKSTNGTDGLRHKITHLQLAEQSDIQRMADLGVIAILQPNWAYKEDGYYDQAVAYLGKERADAQYPLQSFVEAGVMVTGSSDFPVTVDWSPLEGVEVGVTRSALGDESRESALNPKEAASIDTMIRAYTINGAFANRAEKSSGSLEVGKEADFVVLNQDVFQIQPHKIAATKIVATYNDGVDVLK
ncbi:MAG: amidohydrolase [Bacilli bacterium]